MFVALVFVKLGFIVLVPHTCKKYMLNWVFCNYSINFSTSRHEEVKKKPNLYLSVPVVAIHIFTSPSFIISSAQKCLDCKNYLYVGLLTGYHCVFKHMKIKAMSHWKINYIVNCKTDIHITFKNTYSA